MVIILEHTLWCNKCNSVVITDKLEFQKYNDKIFTCNRCLEIRPLQEYAIDTDIYSGLIDRRHENHNKDLDYENSKPPKKRRKTDK